MGKALSYNAQEHLRSVPRATAMSTRKYKNIEVTGPTSVISEGLQISNGEPCNITLLIGLTGSGKSSFVECVANDKSLGIAKDQLDGATTALQLYEIKNIQRNAHPNNLTFLIDTPGFADNKFPESKTLRMILEWIAAHQVYFSQIFYFDRITDPRMAGSKARVLDILKGMTGQRTGKNITIVTTMWDQLWKDEQIEKAHQRMEQMITVHYNDFLTDGARIVRFENTHESAMNILDECLVQSYGNFFSFENVVRNKEILAGTIFGRSLRTNLLQRKAALLQQLKTIDDDLHHESTLSQPELLDVLEREESQALESLAVVEEELQEFPDIGLNPDITSPDAEAITDRTGFTEVEEDTHPFPWETSARSSQPQPKRFKARFNQKAQQFKGLFGRRK